MSRGPRRPLRRAVRLAGSTAACLLAAMTVVGVAPAPKAYAADIACDSLGAGNGETTVPSTTAGSPPLSEMQVTAAQDFLTGSGGQAAPGQGVDVAVLDSGVTPGIGIPVETTVVLAGATLPAPTFYHGTDTAGLIAGAARSGVDNGGVGIAPGATILDVRVYDDPDATGADGSPITSANVLAGLEQVLALVQAGTYPIKVVAVPLEVGYLDGTQVVIDQLWQAGVVIVAPSGNRPAEGSTGPLPSTFASPSAGEDAAAAVYPAHYDHVLVAGSSTTGADDPTPQTYVLQNSDIDVVAPTASSVSYSVVGGTCVNALPATSWSTAYVAGVLALDQSYYDEPPAKAVSRLLNTADGRADIPNNLVGAGEVQPLAALRRPLQIDDDGHVVGGRVAQTQPQVVRAPTTPPDILASTRRSAVWWGLAGGGALLVALMLRPVLARRRRAPDRLTQ